jgi:hypothetical protein
VTEKGTAAALPFPPDRRGVQALRFAIPSPTPSLSLNVLNARGIFCAKFYIAFAAEGGWGGLLSGRMNTDARRGGRFGE